MTHAAAPLTSVAVVGAGAWGTALAALLARQGSQVTLWCREPEVAEGILRQRRNPFHLSDMDLPPGVRPTTDLAAVARDHELLVMVVPTQFTRGVLTALRPHVSAHTAYVTASKGIELHSGALVSDIYRDVLGEAAVRRVCPLSGPSFAREVLLGLPTAVAIAGEDPQLLSRLQRLFHTEHFRTYTSDDVVGVELGGAVKNVIAIACGIGDGLGFGHNARAALITRGLAEITRLGVALGGRPETFAGLSGMGDLLLTATSEQSRNRTLGFRLGRGETLAAIQSGGRDVAEGVATARSVEALARRLGVDMPITAAVDRILHAGADPRGVVAELLRRDPRPESD
ncbi:MAG: NAD(P)-dependent glycerol-3-phosphate dehydrogenase [Magnetococcus sp. WYHC-3]